MTKPAPAAEKRPDVVVIGAGPVGLVAACELARHGLAVRVFDKLPAPTDESRAIVVHARSLEMFERVGVVDEIIDSGVKSLAMQMYASGKRLARIELGQVDSVFPFTITTPQTETERILTARLNGLGVRVERGAELTALGQDADAVHLTLLHADGARESVDTSWVIGADGSHSTVRALLGTKLIGAFKGERFILGDVEAEYSLDQSSMHTYFSPSVGPLLVFPMRGTRVRLIAQVDDPDGRPVATNPTQAELQQIVDARAGGIRITQAHWLTEFEIHHAQVPAYRIGRAFLAGDAAHVHSPAGGQGPGHEHRHAGRVQPRLEARHDRARHGRPAADRQLPGRAASGRGEGHRVHHPPHANRHSAQRTGDQAQKRGHPRGLGPGTDPQRHRQPA